MIFWVVKGLPALNIKCIHHLWILPFLCACKVPFRFNTTRDLPPVSSVCFVGCWESFYICFSNLTWIYVGGRQWACPKPFGRWTYSRSDESFWTFRKRATPQYFVCTFQISAEPVSLFPTESLIQSLFVYLQATYQSTMSNRDCL